jgi:predicted ester cyclase
MSTLNNLLLCRGFAQRLINERNLDLAPRFIAEGSIHHELGGLLPDSPCGPQAMAQFLGLYLRAFPDLRIDFEDAFAAGDRVVTRWHLEGTHEGPLMALAPSGRKVRIEGIRIDRIANGKIAESWMQMDTLALLEQIGALGGALCRLRTAAAAEPVAA